MSARKALASLVALLSACGADGASHPLESLDRAPGAHQGDRPRAEEGPDVTAAEELALESAQGSLRGAVGPVAGLPGALTRFTVEGYPGMTVFNLHGESAQGAAMAIVAVGGGFDQPLLQPGASAMVRREDAHRQGRLFLQVVGCAGPEEGDWDYDAPADEVDVIILSGSRPGERRLGFTARWLSRSGDVQSQVEGHIVVPQALAADGNHRQVTTSNATLEGARADKVAAWADDGFMRVDLEEGGRSIRVDMTGALHHAELVLADRTFWAPSFILPPTGQSVRLTLRDQDRARVADRTHAHIVDEAGARWFRLTAEFRHRDPVTGAWLETYDSVSTAFAVALPE